MFNNLVLMSHSKYVVLNIILMNSALAMLSAFVISVIFGKRIISFLQKIQMRQSVRLEGPESHLKKSGTPTMGGVLLILVIISCSLIWGSIFSLELWLCVGVTFLFGVIGLYDDYLKVKHKNSKGISAKLKFLFQALTAVAAVTLLMFFNGDASVTTVHVPHIMSIDIGWYYTIWALLVVVGSSNAVNLTDGLDGLASSQVSLICIGLILASLLVISSDISFINILQARDVLVFLAILLGASLGFLWFNSHPASVFMGDVGSLALGGGLGISALLLKLEICFALMSLIFIAETLSVIIQVVSFKLRKKRVFRMAPIHHHFELGGLSETKIVTRFFIITLCLVLTIPIFMIMV